MTQKTDSPPKVFCFNYGVDTGGQLTNESRMLAQRAFEWLSGQTYKLTLELKYVLIPGNPNLDVVVFATNFWTLNGWGTNNLHVTIPMDNVMTGTNLYWVMYTYPWDATNAWRTHKGFFSSGNDGLFTTLGGFGLQILGITETAFAGRDWDMWVAYNTQGSNLLTHFGIKDKGSLANEDNFNDGDTNGWTVTSNTNVAWSVTNGALRAAVDERRLFVDHEGLACRDRPEHHHRVQREVDERRDERRRRRGDVPGRGAGHLAARKRLARRRDQSLHEQPAGGRRLAPRPVQRARRRAVSEERPA